MEPTHMLYGSGIRHEERGGRNKKDPNEEHALVSVQFLNKRYQSPSGLNPKAKKFKLSHVN